MTPSSSRRGSAKNLLKDSKPEEPKYCCCCNIRLNGVTLIPDYPTCLGERICHVCEKKFERTQPPKIRPTKSLQRYVRDVERGVIKCPYRITTTLFFDKATPKKQITFDRPLPLKYIH